ncbi:MAG TPA: nucleotide exchange factor GrpE [Rhodanobacteraceae bacterium]|nr:nucleotide exchange factor GrpE [Rhodanobacteraceae bacterium]
MQEFKPDPATGESPDVQDLDAPMQELEELNTKLAEADATIASLRDTLLREHAEIENQRRRVARDLDQARRFANEKLLRELLPVCDNLERGLAIDHPGADGLREGMQLTLKSLLKVMADHGLTPVDPAEGDAFNPELHEAVSLVPAAPGQAADGIVSVLEKGYVLNERLLRPARVVVAKGN